MKEITTQLIQINWFLDPQWWAIIVALALGLGGIFQDWIKKLIWKPKIDIAFRLNPPDSHKIPMRDRFTGQILYNTYYLRARIHNSGNYQLEDVEVMAIELSKKESNGQFKNDDNFLPLNLVWAHSQGREITKPKIQPKMFKFLDFGHISEVSDQEMDVFGINSTDNVVLALDVEVPPNTGSHLIFPGEYRIKLIFAANNLSPVTKCYSLVIADKWTEDQDEMLGKNIVIREESGMY